MAVEDINFLDIAVLMKLTPDTPMEKLGGLINASFFDASFIAGSLKQKGLIEFSSDYPGPNAIIITQVGKNLLAEAETKGVEPFDNLDTEILEQLSTGKRTPTELVEALNLRNKDVALHIYKLYKQNFIIYELKNGNVDLLLTEGGFLKIKMNPGESAPMPMAQKSDMQKKKEVVTKEIQENFKLLNMKQKEEKGGVSVQANLKKNGVGIRTIVTIIVIIVVVAALVYFKKIG